ncbi:PhoH family protein [Komagataeibacter rhaeticus]|uniref:PhoH family protein n=1 Tax=Komagataeibacter rhaeticus TaxID=215221 RepID=UPI0007E19011|nr:PhoH family protein [Komagataeibacter rhaeticus]SAY46663.1 hypothetical protein KRIGEM_03552 [Komagataeibacter rhaeticus]
MTAYCQEIEDLKIFCDAFAESHFSVKDNGEWTAIFERKGERIALSKKKDGKIFSIDSGNLVAGNFKSLLASKQFSNIKYLARSVLHEYSFSSDNFMNVPFKLHGNTEVTDFNGVETFLSHLAQGGVVGLEGPAGAGKTHFIERLAAESAKSLHTGSSVRPLIIPVVSAGKILSAIDDRIDGSLSALRANFNRSELPCLMRNGLISIAIDGFDELSDSRGYDNSWSALRELLRDVGAGGLILLSGRDSFISIDVLKDFIGNSLNIIGLSLHSLNIGFPKASDVCSWISKENHKWVPYMQEAKERFEDFSWLRRPFFVSQISKMDPELFLNTDDEPIISLCSAMVTREVDKIGIPSEVSPKSGENIVYSILMEAARTMLDYEIDYVDPSLLEVAVEVACEEHASGNEDFSRALSSRAKTLSLLEPAPGTGDRNNRKFAHEKIKAFFYSRYLIDEIPSDSPSPLGLRRGQLTLSDLSVFSALLRTKKSESIHNLFTALTHRLKQEVVGGIVSSNLGALLIACLPEDRQSKHARISGWQIMDSVFPVSPAGTLKDIYFNRMDVRGCNLSQVIFENCEVGEAIVSTDTRFGTTSPICHSMIVEDASGLEIKLRDSNEISDHINNLQVVYRQKSSPNLPDTLEPESESGLIDFSQNSADMGNHQPRVG